MLKRAGIAPGSSYGQTGLSPHLSSTATVWSYEMLMLNRVGVCVALGMNQTRYQRYRVLGTDAMDEYHAVGSASPAALADPYSMTRLHPAGTLDEMGGVCQLV